MKTLLMIAAQYEGAAVVSVERVCRDYFSHLSVDVFVRKVAAGEIKLPIVRMEPSSRKSARGVHIQDLADYIDQRRAEARKELAAMAEAYDASRGC